MNYLSLHDYRNAIQLALAMDQPGRLLNLFRSIQSESPDGAEPQRPSFSGHPSVDTVLRTLADTDLARLLRYIRLWNATAKTSAVAQRVLHALLKLRPVDDIIHAFEDDSTSGAGVEESNGTLTVSVNAHGEGRGATALKDWVEAIIPYTERHLNRMERLLQDSYVVDYLLGEMDGGLFDELDDLDVNEGSAMEVDRVIELAA